ncbi:MAG: 4-hydroxy-2-oxoheptanedioate aldolase, partial [Yoonia sp.]
MKMATNRFAKALIDGDKQIGLWISLCSNVVAEVTAHAGYDWALIDMEHTPNDYLSVLGQLQAFAASDTTAIVRVEWNDAVAVKRLLDLGASGLLFPMIRSVSEAEKAVAATRYPPHGIRGYSGATRATKFGRVTDYTAQIETETAVLLQLETRAAIAQAEVIAAVKGVSGIFFGPADIAADIGKLGKPMDPEVWALIKPAAKA